MHENLREEKRNYNSLLIAIGLLASIVEGVFLFPLPRVLRLEGSAIFIAAITLPLMLDVFSNYAFPSQLSRKMRARVINGDVDGVTRLFQKSWITMTIIGLILAAIIFFSASSIASSMRINLIGDTLIETVEFDELEVPEDSPVQSSNDESLALSEAESTYSANIGNAADALKTIAPFVFVSFAASAFKAYFMAINLTISIEIARLFTQIVKLASGLVLAGMFSKNGLIASVDGALWGLIIGEVVGVIFLIVMYFLNVGSTELYRYRSNWNGKSKTKNINFDLITSIGPSLAVFLSLFALHFMMFYDAQNLIKTMLNSGFEHVLALRSYGLLFAMCWPIAMFAQYMFYANFRGVFISVNKTAIEKHFAKRAQIAESVLRVSALVGFGAATLIFTMGGELFTTLFGGILLDYEIAAAFNIIKIISFGAAFISVGISMSSYLVGMDQSPIAAIITVFSIAVKIVVGIFTTRMSDLNVLGAAFSTVVALGVYALLNTIFASQMSGARRSWLIGIGKPIISSVIAYLVADLLFMRFIGTLLSGSFALIAGTIVVLIVYLASNFLLNTVSQKDLRRYPLFEGDF